MCTSCKYNFTIINVFHISKDHLFEEILQYDILQH